MAKFSKMQVMAAMKETGMVPVFFNKDIEICKNVIKACYEGGVRVFEFTNRGDFAAHVFYEVTRHFAKADPSLIPGLVDESIRWISPVKTFMRSATEALGKDNVFQLRALLTERAGFNLRNLYSHGLLTDDAVHNNGLFMLWWLLLRMTLFVPWGIEWHRKRMDDARENAAAGR